MERYFNSIELACVASAAASAEELVNNHFKLSSGLWLKSCYDIKTARDLDEGERVQGAFAQVVKYEGHPARVRLGSSSFNLYRVCIQDGEILSALTAHPRMGLEPFLIYVLVHELVHVVRFVRFEHRYENAEEADVSHGEEVRVHGITRQVLDGIAIGGLSEVLGFFGKWQDSGPG